MATKGKLRPGCYRPTTLKLASRHCPRAINHYQRNDEVDRDIFSVGIAVHALIQSLIEATNQLGRPLDDDEVDVITLSACRRMIREGRTFEGEPEPPLAADAVWQGRELALGYVARHPIEPATYAELGMAVDERWKPTRYSAEARLRLISDYVTVYVEESEESAARVLVVRDYKSAWPTSAKELDTVQLRAQAVLAYLFHGSEVDCVRQEVVNLRTGATYPRELWLIEDGGAMLERWRVEIEATMEALDESRDPEGLYPAAPGGGCIGCPYLPHCEPGRSWSERAFEGESPEDRAVAYVATLARLKGLQAVLKKETAEVPIRLPGGQLVGCVAKESRKPQPDAWQRLLDEWEGRGGDAGGLLLALSVGVGQIERAAKQLYPERSDVADRKAWVASLTEPHLSPGFGVHADDTDLLAALRASLAKTGG